MYWYSRFGKVEVEETVWRDRQARQKRPFCEQAQIYCRACSLPLQRCVVDLAADIPFAAAQAKLKEHHGVELSISTLRRITLGHAKGLDERQILPKASYQKAPVLIAETDGSLIPTVQCTSREGDEKPDRRRVRVRAWKEVRVSLVRRPEAQRPVYAATLGSAAEAGNQLRQLAQRSGLRPKSRVHGLGDGAPWIAEQMEAQFGSQGSYLIDFYHLCGYLAAAAPVCAPQSPKSWLEEQKTRFKTGEQTDVLKALRPHREPEASTPTPVRDAYRYIDNRPGQFDYLRAIQADLPIGSGEIESAHRSLVQKRLKLPGAAWLPDNAQAMLNLRTLRANSLWNSYWASLHF